MATPASASPNGNHDSGQPQPQYIDTNDWEVHFKNSFSLIPTDESMPPSISKLTSPCTDLYRFVQYHRLYSKVPIITELAKVAQINYSLPSGV